MEWTIVVALAIVVPVVLVPVAFIWYLNIGGIVHAVREAKALKAKKAAAIKMTS